MNLNTGGGKKKGITPDINVTPLVDVVLVLLIIFMVVIPNVQDGKTIKLFAARDAEKSKEDKDRVVVTVDDEGQRYWLDQPISAEQLPTKLSEAFETKPNGDILIRGDADAKIGIMRSVFRTAQQAGDININLAVSTQKDGWAQDELAEDGLKPRPNRPGEKQ